jgi:hypothetical protein
VLPDQDIETTFYKTGSADGVTTYAYQTAVGDDLVIRDGLVELTD